MKKLLDSICCIAQEAGELIMRHYGGDVPVERKSDNSPVTQADLAANAYIIAQLEALTPEIPIISEEMSPHVLPEGATRFWLVDPLDGTKSFIRREGEFTVNIALIEQGAPVMGVVYLPVPQTLYSGWVGHGAWRTQAQQEPQPITTRIPPESGMHAVVSLSHLDRHTAALLDRLPIAGRVQAASSLKFCRVAEGTADIYPRFGPTMEWDTAAGHAVLLAAGGRMEQPDGSPFTYGAADFRNGAFIAWGT